MTKLEVEHERFFFSKSTVPKVKRIIVHFHVQSGDKVELFRFMIRELLGLLKTFRRQNIALKMRKIVKKKVLKCCPKSEKLKCSARGMRGDFCVFRQRLENLLKTLALFAGSVGSRQRCYLFIAKIANSFVCFGVCAPGHQNLLIWTASINKASVKLFG